MELLRSGVGCTVIALWLGHESVETTQIYLHTGIISVSETFESMLSSARSVAVRVLNQGGRVAIRSRV